MSKIIFQSSSVEVRRFPDRQIVFKFPRLNGLISVLTEHDATGMAIKILEDFLQPSFELAPTSPAPEVKK